MDDMISRQALMKEFSDFVRASNNSDFARTPTWNDAVSLVESMPSAQPERKQGRWKEHIFEGIMGGRPRALMCNQCNSLSLHATNFCPNCGAHMMEGEG